MEFIDDGRLTDTGISGNEHQLRRAALYDTIEATEQCLDFTLAAVEFLRNQKAVGRVVLAKLEFVDVALSLPFRKTAPKIAFNAGCRLIAFLSVLGQELHHDGRDRNGQAWYKLGGRHRLSRNVAMDPVHRIGGHKRQLAG